jgi:hypothetical protein
MKFFDSVFNAFLSRDQRERVQSNKWDKSVAAASLALALENSTPKSSTPRYTPALSELDTSIPSSHAMTPSLSSSSSTTSSSGRVSPTTRPSTSYSTSPRPEFRRHTSIAREPISYDALMTMPPSEKKKPRRASSDSCPATQQLLYPLPPLGPMEGIGKDRRSVDVTDEYLCSLQRNTLAALQPLVGETDRISRFKRDTTTPPRAHSVSPPMERQQAMQRELEEWADATAAGPIIEEFEDVPGESEIAPKNNSRPVRVASKKRSHTASRERSRGGNKRVQRQGPQAVGGISRAAKGKQQQGYKPRGPPKKEMQMSASMETLLSGEE